MKRKKTCDGGAPIHSKRVSLKKKGGGIFCAQPTTCN